MGFLDFLSSSTPAGVAASTAKAIAGTVFDGVDKIIRDFKLPPEELVKYEQFKLEQTAKLEAIDQADRASARGREMVLRDWTPSSLAWLFVLIFAAAQWFVFTHPLPAGSETLIARVLGTLDMAVGMILGYYFGSSASSRSKEQLIGQMVNGGSNKVGS